MTQTAGLFTVKVHVCSVSGTLLFLGPICAVGVVIFTDDDCQGEYHVTVRALNEV